MGAPLVITEQERARALEIIVYAAAHPYTTAQMAKLRSNLNAKRPGDRPEYRMIIPMGYMAVYSHEEQPSLGLCRHLSVSCSTPGRVPNPVAMTEIMRLFHFELATNRDTPWAQAHIWLEDLADNRTAINALQKINEPSHKPASATLD